MSTEALSKHEEENGRAVTIIVNAKKKQVHQREISFEEVVNLAYDGNPPQGANWVFTVTYARGEGGKPTGTLLAGGRVKVKDEMVFNVTATDKS